MSLSGAWQCVFEMDSNTDKRPAAEFLCLSIGGNIGAGKSTALEAVRQRYADRVMALDAVPGNVPAADGGKPVIICAPEAGGGTWSGYLVKFYRNPEKYAFRMHAEVMRHFHEITESSRIARRMARLGTPVVFLVERCPAEVAEIFVAQNRAHFTDTQLAMFSNWAHAYQLDLEPWCSATYIYARTDPAICAARVNARARDGEVGAVDVAYLRALHDRFETLYATHDMLDPQHIMVVDGNTKTAVVDALCVEIECMRYVD